MGQVFKPFPNGFIMGVVLFNQDATAAALQGRNPGAAGTGKGIKDNPKTGRIGFDQGRQG